MMITQLGSIFGDFQVASIISGKELSQQILSELESEVRLSSGVQAHHSQPN